MTLLRHFRTGWNRITFPGEVEQELIWRGYALNSLILSLLLFAMLFFLINVIFWWLGLDDGATALAVIPSFCIYAGLLWVSRSKSITLAILLFSLFNVFLGFFMSFGWGVSDITVSPIYAAAIVITSLLLRGRAVLWVTSILVLGYLGISTAQLDNLFSPPFYTDLGGNYLTMTLFMAMLGVFGFITATLIDRVIAAQTLEAARRQELESRTRIATELQLSMLPEEPLLHPCFDVAGQSIPARDVGGDFYSYHRPAADQLVVIIGDVTGKGIPAALLMAVTTGLLNSVVSTTSEPAGLLEDIETHLQPHSRRSGLSVTCLAALFAGSRLSIANAGSVEPILRRADGRVEWLMAGGLPLPLGLEMNQANAERRQVETSLAVGDTVIFISDGVVEARDGNNRLLSFEPFEQIVAAGPATSALAMKQHILAQLQHYRGEREQDDDVTVVVVRLKETGTYAT